MILLPQTSKELRLPAYTIIPYVSDCFPMPQKSVCVCDIEASAVAHRLATRTSILPIHLCKPLQEPSQPPAYPTTACLLPLPHPLRLNNIHPPTYCPVSFLTHPSTHWILSIHLPNTLGLGKAGCSKGVEMNKKEVSTLDPDNTTHCVSTVPMALVEE